MEQWDVITFGEPLVNFVADEVGDIRIVSRFTRSLGGAEANVAVGLARLNRKSRFTTQLGKDILADYTVSALDSEGVDTSLIRFHEEAMTGYQFKTRVEVGDPEVYYFRRGSAASRMTWHGELDDAVRDTSHIHLSGIPLALSESTRDVSAHFLKSAKAHGVRTTFDPNLRPSLWQSREEMIEIVNQFAVQADIVLPGLEEGRTLTRLESPQDIADFYLNKGVRLVVVKLGPDGAYFKNEREEGTVQGFAIDHVVDTVGAGDGFAVGLIDALLSDSPVQVAVTQGCAVGAMAVMSRGDHDGYPDRSALSTFMDTHSRRSSKC